MRIALVASSAIPVPPVRYGGTELIIYYLIRGLMAAGHEPVLLASGDSKVDCELVPITRKALYFPKFKKDVPAYQRKVARVEATTRRKLREILPRVDIVHSHGFDLRAFKDLPSLTTLHGTITFESPFPVVSATGHLGRGV